MQTCGHNFTHAYILILRVMYLNFDINAICKHLQNTTVIHNNFKHLLDQFLN